jgi:twitching motility protein PilT
VAKLDRFIRTIVDRRISFAVLQPDQEIMLDMGGGDTRAFNDHVLTARQVQMMLGELIPDRPKESLRESGRAEFEYTSPDGPVDVTALRRGGKLSVYLSMARTIDYQDGNHDDGFDLEVSEAASEFDGVGSPAESEGGEWDAELGSGDEWSDEPAGLDEAFGPSELSEVSSFGELDAGGSAGGGQDESSNQTDTRAVGRQEPGMEPPINQYLRVMDEQDCSDLHLTSQNQPMYRKDGEMALIGDMRPLSANEVEELLLPIMPDRNHEEFLEVWDTDFAYEIDGVGRFRCNVFMDRLGPGAVFRIIPDEILTAEDLGLSQHLLDLCHLNKGMVLVTGPTGSGKSTTLAALIDYINRNRKSHIITVEDPIEFVHPNKKCLINQREVGVHTMSFHNAIRAALREDPDIVLVGELRDLETIHMAIETAETGHLVFGTLHTNTAPSTVDRLIDQFPSDRQSQIRTMLSGSLRAVIAQTLCKKIGGGRVAAMEVLMGTRAVSNLIRTAKTHQIPSVMETKKSEGMVGMNDSLFELVEQGKITAEEARFNAVDKDDLLKRLKRQGHRVSGSV